MSKIYGIAGRKRSGKSVIASTIKEIIDTKDCAVVLFANSLKFLCCDLLSVEFDELNRMKDDGTVLNILANERWVNIIHNRTGIDRNVVSSAINGVVFKDVRHILQFIGTDVIRKYKPSWHIDETKKEILSYGDDYTIIVDDVRFPNEREMLESLGAEVYFVFRPYLIGENVVSNHISEISLSWQDFDMKHIIINNGTEDELKVLVKTVFCGINNLEERNRKIGKPTTFPSDKDYECIPQMRLTYDEEKKPSLFIKLDTNSLRVFDNIYLNYEDIIDKIKVSHEWYGDIIIKNVFALENYKRYL